MAIFLLGTPKPRLQQEHTDMLRLSTLGPHNLREPLVPSATAAPSIPEPSKGKGVVSSLRL